MHAVDDGDAEIAAAAYAEGVRDGRGAARASGAPRAPATQSAPSVGWQILGGAGLISVALLLAGLLLRPTSAKSDPPTVDTVTVTAPGPTVTQLVTPEPAS